MAEEEIEKTALNEVKSLITGLGSWPLSDASWNESTWNPIKLLAEFQRDFSSGSPMFVLGLNVNPFNSSKHILQVLHY